MIVRCAFLQLPLILSFIEMSKGLRDQSVGTDRPLLMPADTDSFPFTCRTGVRPGQHPVINNVVPIETEAVHRYDHIREGGHETLCR